MLTLISAPPISQKQLEDPLAYLPCSTIQEYRKGQLIYSQDQPSTKFFLIIAGWVKVSRLTDDGKQVVVDIYQADEFFGESTFLGSQTYREQVTAVEETRLMTWDVSVVEDLMMKRPQLGIALLQILASRTTGFKARIESLAVDTIERRLARTLVRLSERFGVAEDDGTVSMMALTHEFLAQYVGTTREIVTLHMNKIRTQGSLQYSRKGITVNRESLLQSLRQGA